MKNEKYFTVYRSKAKQGKYSKGCQDWLKVLKSDYYDEYSKITVPKGTVTYIDRERYSFIYLSGQLKAELTVCRTLGPKPEPDAFFCIGEYAGDTFYQPIIAERYFFFHRSCSLYNCEFQGIRFRLHGNMSKKCHA